MIPELFVWEGPGNIYEERDSLEEIIQVILEAPGGVKPDLGKLRMSLITGDLFEYARGLYEVKRLRKNVGQATN